MNRRSHLVGRNVLLGLSALLPLACSGDDGAAGPIGPAGPAAINASTANPSELEQLDIESSITNVTIASPPVITFKVETAAGVPIVGLVPYWEGYNRFIRFTLTKLVPGTNGDPDSWVAYTRDETSGAPDYDTGSSVVDNDDGTYTFTFNTDVTAVTGVTYEPTLTHRIAGQIGRSSLVPLEEQNLWLDFVPDGTAVANTRNIAVMESCNECHSNLNFHGRRLEVEYCVQCHNPDLAEGEGNFSFMIHRIHNAGTFTVLDNGIDYSEVTYPQEVINCRKCHNADDTATTEADNWRMLPNMAACDGCHDIFNANAANTHSGPAQTTNETCTQCHTPTGILEAHMTDDPTPNNPEVTSGQHIITYEFVSAVVETNNDVTIQFKILSDGTPLDLLNLPAEFLTRRPGFLLAYALPQDGITAPADWNNDGQNSAQPITLDLGDFGPSGPTGTLAFDAGTGVMTAVVTDAGSQFPSGATMRAVGLQGYLQQDVSGSTKSLHTPSVVVAVTGDDERRTIIDTTKCAACHDWFSGHGGNRIVSPGSDNVCVLCHVPNQSSSGREIDPATVSSELSAEAIAIIGSNPLVYPEDAQNFKDMIHGIHAEGFRDRAYEHVRGPTREGYYDWSHITFPRGAETNNCALCHDGDSYELPLNENVLPTTVRTTAQADGQDPNLAAVQGAFANVPNSTDWINSPTSSSCYYCHTTTSAWAHMVQNGGLLSNPLSGPYSNRSAVGTTFETCNVCHGPGRSADVELVHNR